MNFRLKLVIVVLAISTGIAVSDLYYLQPLLGLIKKDFTISSFQATAFVSFTQIGYALGLLLLVPLGDIFARRKLTISIFCLSVGFLLLVGLTTKLFLLGVFLFFVGVFSVVTHIMVPYATQIAPEHLKARVIGRIMSGLLAGILLSRAFSGIVANFLGWRAVYLLGAGLVSFCAILLLIALPKEAPRANVNYGRLIGEGFLLLKRSQLFKIRMLYGMLSFGEFSILWSTIAFLLSKYPYKFSTTKIGLLSVLGIGGILAANLAGRLADTNREDVTTFTSGLLFIIAFAILALDDNNLLVVILGIILVDFATQANHITNQSLIFSIDYDRRSSINGLYMTGNFLSGAILTLFSGLIYDLGGFTATSVVGIFLGVLTLGLYFFATYCLRKGKEPSTVSASREVF